MKKAFPTSWYPWPSEDNHACPVLVEPLSDSMDQSKSWLGHDKDLPPPRPHWDQRHSFYVFPPPPHGCFFVSKTCFLPPGLAGAPASTLAPGHQFSVLCMQEPCQNAELITSLPA